MIETKWVRPEERRAHLRVLLCIIFGENLGRAGVRSETTGVTLGDVAVLASLVWPDGNWWWNDFRQRVPDDLRPILLQQHPGLLEVNTDDLTDATFERWLAEQAPRFGGAEWLAIAPAPLPTTPPAVRPQVRGI